MCLKVLDRAIQGHGAKGVCQDTMLPWMWAGARTLRLAGKPNADYREEKEDTSHGFDIVDTHRSLSLTIVCFGSFLFRRS